MHSEMGQFRTDQFDVGAAENGRKARRNNYNNYNDHPMEQFHPTHQRPTDFYHYQRNGNVLKRFSETNVNKFQLFIIAKYAKRLKNCISVYCEIHNFQLKYFLYINMFCSELCRNRADKRASVGAVVGSARRNSYQHSLHGSNNWLNGPENEHSSAKVIMY